MKKFYLVLVAVMATAGLHAQSAQTRLDRVMVKADNRVNMVAAPEATMVGAEATTSTKHKSATTGVYYSRPSGTLVYHWNSSGSGYGSEYNIVPPFDDFTFVNRSSSPTTCYWSSSNSWYDTWYDYSDYADSDGSLTSYLSPGYYMPAPTVSNEAKTDSFTMLEAENYYYYYYGDTYQTIVMPDSIFAIGYASDHGYSGSYSFGGGTTTGYLGGTITLSSYGYIGYGIEQSYPEPASPLYVEDIYMMYMADSDTPLPDGAELTMYIYNDETDEAEYVLTATADDIIEWYNGSTSYTTTGAYYAGAITFSQKTTDDFGNTSAEPFTIDFPFTVDIIGYDGDGVSIGVTCDAITDDVADELGVFYMLVYDPDTYDAYGFYYSDCTLNLTFNAMFDKIYVADELEDTDGNVLTECNYLRVSDDGTTCYIEGQEDLTGAYVMTAIDWYDSDGNENYYFDLTEDEEEWIEGWAAADDVYSYAYAVTFTCSKITSGGRYAVLYVQGKGVESNVPLVILQGDITLDDVDLGIAGVTADSEDSFDATAPKYNLSGARVNDSYKGVFIQDGRKFISK